MENEHELSYKTLTRVYLGSYELYKSVGAELEHPKPGFELIAWKQGVYDGDVVRLEWYRGDVEVVLGVCGVAAEMSQQ
ncbi:hypothetical protein Tco_1232725, partial [Tanacetum coccineum]